MSTITVLAVVVTLALAAANVANADQSPRPPAVAQTRPVEPFRIVCLGDSVTVGARDGVKPEEAFCRVLEKTLTQAGVKAEVINAGVGGHTTTMGFARLDRDVLDKKPTHAVIMFGINDSWIDKDKTASRVSVADYTANLKKMTAALQAKGVKPILMTPNPVWQPFPYDRNVTLRKYVDAVRAVARDEHLPLLDVYARFAESNLEGLTLADLLVDGMHPGPKGHIVIADMLAKHFVPPAP